jgi:hypothetical protein
VKILKLSGGVEPPDIGAANDCSHHRHFQSFCSLISKKIAIVILSTRMGQTNEIDNKQHQQNIQNHNTRKQTITDTHEKMRNEKRKKKKNEY